MEDRELPSTELDSSSSSSKKTNSFKTNSSSSSFRLFLENDSYPVEIPDIREVRDLRLQPPHARSLSWPNDWTVLVYLKARTAPLIARFRAEVAARQAYELLRIARSRLP
jgi:hypothetical protein